MQNMKTETMLSFLTKFPLTLVTVRDGTYYWQKGKALYSDTSGSGWGMNGVLPKTIAGTSEDAMYGKDYVYLKYAPDRVLLVAGNYRDGAIAGSWYRYGSLYWGYVNLSVSFRAAAYAP